MINFRGNLFSLFKLNPPKHKSHEGGENWVITFVLFIMTSGPKSLLEEISQELHSIFTNLKRQDQWFTPSINYCFLICIQISQEASQVVWYSHLFRNFAQFVVIHTVKGFGVVNKAKVDVFLEFSSFFYHSVDVGNLISGSSAFSKSSLSIWKFSSHTLAK